jgi:hypothetical protein
MVDDRQTIGDELDVRIHYARVIGPLHIQPGRTGRSCGARTFRPVRRPELQSPRRDNMSERFSY